MAIRIPGTSAGVGTEPPAESFEITPHDSNDEAEICRCIYVGVSGDVSVVHPSGTTTLFKNIAAGLWHPMVFRRINSTNTTATDIIGGY